MQFNTGKCFLTEKLINRFKLEYTMVGEYFEIFTSILLEMLRMKLIISIKFDIYIERQTNKTTN